MSEMMQQINGVGVERLISNFGSPLYIFSALSFKANYLHIKQVFDRAYENTNICYSYKTNYLLGVCSYAVKLGLGAEVVSDFELDIARKAGAGGKHIVYNGPCKTVASLKTAVLLGTKINIDNWEEAVMLNSICRKLKLKNEVGVRVNVNDSWGRFGFNIESGEAGRICREINTKLPHLVLSGFHFHYGTNITNLAAYEKALQEVLVFIAKISEEVGFALKYIDLGGGFPTVGAYPDTVKKSQWKIPRIENFARIIARQIKNNLQGVKPELVIEPGRFLVDDAFFLLTTVYSVKNIRGVRSLVVDAGTNTSSTFFYMNHGVDYFTHIPKGRSIITDVYGPLCMQADILSSGVNLPLLNAGDVLVYKSIGAYSYSRSMQFIKTRPAVVGIFNRKPAIIRRREKTEDVLKLDMAFNQ